MVFYFNRIFLKNWKNPLQKSPPTHKIISSKGHLKFQFSIMVHFFGPNLYLPPSMTPAGHFLPSDSHPAAPLPCMDISSQVGLGSSLYSYPEGQPLLGTLLRVPFDIPADPALGEQCPSVPSPSNYDWKFSSLASDWIGTTYYLYK